MDITTVSSFFNTRLSQLSPYVGIHLTSQIHIIVSRLITYLPQTLNLSLAPILALATFSHVPKRTIQYGTSTLLDTLIISPGIHKHSTSASLHGGEYPATAAMTTGYVFRTENQAMVYYMQVVGVTGSLVTLSVADVGRHPFWELLFGPRGIDAPSAVAMGLTLDVLAGCWIIGDTWSLICVGSLIASRFLNILAIRMRLAPQWHGAAEPGVKGDLLVLLSQDRWVRIKGWVDDLKAVTSGQWLQDPTLLGQCLVDAGTVLVYASVVMGFNASQKGALMVVTLLLGSSVLLSISNARSRKRFWMHGRVVHMERVQKYGRRRILTDELIGESGRDDWAMQMGMIPGKEKGGIAIM